MLESKPFELLVELNMKWLTLKTVFLVAIATASRCSDLAKLLYLDPFCVERQSPPGFVLLPADPKKQSRPGHMSEE